MAMTRAQLNQAFREVASMEFADIPCDETLIQFNFSDRFTQKMEKLIARQKKPYWEYVNTVGKKIAIVAILVLSIAVTAFRNEEVRASMLQWCEDIYGEYIRYYFEGDTTKVIEHEYQLTKIPEGFERVYDQRDIETVVIGYENEVGDYIQLEQYATDGYETYIDNENGEWSTEIIGNKEVILADYGTQMSAMWNEDGYFMFLIYYGCDNMEIIKEMVDAVE